ncbi:hypothetical protein BG005_003435, partial [Podila minutissima]
TKDLDTSNSESDKVQHPESKVAPEVSSSSSEASDSVESDQEEAEDKTQDGSVSPGQSPHTHKSVEEKSSVKASASQPDPKVLQLISEEEITATRCLLGTELSEEDSDQISLAAVSELVVYRNLRI